jgi:PTS system glucose-specific IIC component
MDVPDYWTTMGTLYYVLFRTLIKTLNLKTPGRETDDAPSQITEVNGELAFDIVVALGGKENIKSVDACITRLRVSLKSIQSADIDKLKALGAIDVVVIGDNLQAIFGTQSDNIKTEINTVLASA